MDRFGWEFYQMWVWANLDPIKFCRPICISICIQQFFLKDSLTLGDRAVQMGVASGTLQERAGAAGRWVNWHSYTGDWAALKQRRLAWDVSCSTERCVCALLNKIKQSNWPVCSSVCSAERIPHIITCVTLVQHQQRWRRHSSFSQWLCLAQTLGEITAMQRGQVEVDRQAGGSLFV